MNSSTGDKNGSGGKELKNDPAVGSDVIQSSQEQERLIQSDLLKSYQSDLLRLRENGEKLRSDANQPELACRPAWFDPALFENAKSVYGRHFMGINFAHLSGLILLVRIASIYRTLSSTGKSDSVSKLFRRYYQTLIHVKQWYEGDIFEKGSDAYRSLLIVRGMHNKVSSTFNDRKELVKTGTNQSSTSHQDHESSERTPISQDANGNISPEQVHISQYDIMLTQFAFVGFIVTRAKNVGLIDDFDRYDFESLLHFWRVIGYYLGASEEYNLCSRKLDDVVNLCNAIMEFEFKRSIRESHSSSPPAIMGLNIVRSIKFIPMLTFYGITKYLFELMDLDTSELEANSTRYSRLSYTLIELVMSHLLAYRPFRWFNNGLTRLSIYCVGKIEGWFANRLENKYGQVLKI